MKKLTDDINAGKGAIGKLAKDEEFARKLQNTMDKLSAITDRLEAGEGTAGKLLQRSVALQQRRPDAGGNPGTGQSPSGKIPRST